MPTRCLHSDIQLLLVTPIDSSSPIGGVATIFDRNINTNSNAGFDIAAPQTSQTIGRNGLPVFLNKVSVDVNISSGLYTEGYSVGTVKIRYIPSSKHTRGVLSQGKAVVTMYAQIYAPNTSLILRNATSILEVCQSRACLQHVCRGGSLPSTWR